MPLTPAQRVIILRETMTQRAIAKSLGVNVSTVRRWQYDGVKPSPAAGRKLVKKSTAKRSASIKSGRAPLPIPPKTLLHKDSFEVIPYGIPADLTLEGVKPFFETAKWYRDNTSKTVYRLIIKAYQPSASAIEEVDEYLNRDPGEPPPIFYYSTGWARLKSNAGKASDFEIASFIMSSINENGGVIAITAIFVS